MTNNPLLYSDMAADADEIGSIIGIIEDALDGIPPSKRVIALLTLAIYMQKPEMDMQALSDLTFETSKFIVAQLVGDGIAVKDMN